MQIFSGLDSNERFPPFRVDMAIMHSSSVYPSLNLWKEEPSLFRSLVMINPAGHRIIKAMKPEWFVSNMVRLNLTPFGRWLVNLFGQKVIASKGVAVKVDNIDNIMLASTTMFLAKVHRLKSYLSVVKDRKPPTLYIMSENDKLVDRKIFYEMADMLEASDKHFTSYDDDGVSSDGKY